jgi:hypothetical protein
MSAEMRSLRFRLHQCLHVKRQLIFMYESIDIVLRVSASAFLPL